MTTDSPLHLLDTVAYETLLKRLARSFQISLRILPPPLRQPLSLAYMLARASDSIADASAAPAFQRLALLRALPGDFPESAPDLGLPPDERDLVDRLPALLRALEALPDAPIIKEVWSTILEGQAFDVERFAPAENGTPAAPLEPAELDRSIDLVAGSVGEFWTRLCHAKVPGFSDRNVEELAARARRFGHGLQLVNILRDRRADAEIGRIYVPDHRFYEVLNTIPPLLDEGRAYAAAIKPRLLRASAALPEMLARRTLDLVVQHPLGENLRVPRHAVYACLLRSLLLPSPR